MPKPKLEDGDNKVEIATGHNPRMLVVEIDPGRHINPDATAKVKQEYASDPKNGEKDQRRPAMRKVVSNVDRMIDSFSLCAPTVLTTKSLPQNLVRTGLEWFRPPQDNRGEEPAPAARQEMKPEPRDDPGMLHNLIPCKPLKTDRRYASLTMGDNCLFSQDVVTYKTYLPFQGLRNEIPTSGQNRMDKEGYEEKEFVASVQRLKLLMPTGEVKLPRTPTEGAVELPGARGPGLPTDTAEQDDGAIDGEPRRSLRLQEKASQVEDT